MYRGSNSVHIYHTMMIQMVSEMKTQPTSMSKPLTSVLKHTKTAKISQNPLWSVFSMVDFALEKRRNEIINAQSYMVIYGSLRL